MQILEIDSLGSHELLESFEVGILLGGMINIDSDTNKVNFNSNGDRLFQTIDLYKSGRIDKILISSGSGEVQLPAFKESALIKRYLVKIGIPADDVYIEIQSRNTFENAVECKAIIDSIYGLEYNRKVLLITSASHMRRAKKCFEKQMISVVPYSTTKREQPGPFIFSSEMVLPDAEALSRWKVIGHEMAGLLFYKVGGYI